MGKARGPADIYDILKLNHLQTQAEFGLLRIKESTKDRGTSFGGSTAELEAKLKLDRRGGTMKGMFGLAQFTATSNLAVDGIIDLKDYNSPRLVIPNPSGNTLKVLKPVMGTDVVFIRAEDTDDLTIQHTAGAGSESTGNIDLLAQDTYLGSGDDWIGFVYDLADSKFHQFTVGRENIGSGSEVFEWTANHSAENFSLRNIDDLDFVAGGTIDSEKAHINYNSGTNNMEFVLDDATMEWRLFIAGDRRFNLGKFQGTFQFDTFEFKDGTNTTNHVTITGSGLNLHQLDLSNVKLAEIEGTLFLGKFETNTAGIIKAISSTECAFQVTDGSITVGSRGTIQIPTDAFTGSTITDSSTLNSLFGDAQGCMGVTGLRGTGTPIIWVRRADGDSPQWRGASMTVSST